MDEMENKDSINWHSINAFEFESNYQEKSSFKNRLEIWKKNIDKCSSNKITALDLGCGTGALSFYLAKKNKKVYAVDPSYEMLKVCIEKNKDRKINNIEFFNSSIKSFSESHKKKFNLIICSSVLEYVDNFRESLKQIYNLLEKDGILIFSVPNKFSIYRFVESISSSLVDYPKYYKYVKNMISIKKVECILSNMNYQVIEKEYFGNIRLLPKIPILTKNMILIKVKKK